MGQLYRVDPATGGVTVTAPLPPASDYAEMRGWRVQYTRHVPGSTAPPRLFSAMFGPAVRGGIPGAVYDTARQRAGCHAPKHQAQHSFHEPPGERCTCGVYGVANVVDALYRTRAMCDNLIRHAWQTSWWPLLGFPAHGVAVPVLQRVRLIHARQADDIGQWHPLAGLNTQLHTRNPVLRAAESVIEHMFVPPDFAMIDTADAEQLARRLAIAFGAPTTVGYPTYTPRDWDQRPAWLRTEPWQADYCVDEMLASFSRNGFGVLAV